jgi:hypothetical protein
VRLRKLQRLAEGRHPKVEVRAVRAGVVPGTSEVLCPNAKRAESSGGDAGAKPAARSSGEFRAVSISTGAGAAPPSSAHPRRQDQHRRS